MFLKEGTVLEGGKYRIMKVLGQGGFGITYLAMNTILEVKVAIKEFFPREFCGRGDTSHVTIGTDHNRDTVEKLKARFIKEAKNLAKLHYEGIVGIRDVFEENETAYYVMEYIEGQTLTEIVKKNGALDEKTAVGYIEEVGKALEYIHSRNMTHFDVKPSNIMINSETGRPVLIDFGLSKQYDYEGQATSSMLQGVSQGFSALEMYNPGTLNNFSPKTDVYSLAATLYYLLTANVPPVATQLVEEGLSMPAVISPHIREAIRKAMSSTRSNRHESVKEFCRSIADASYRPQTVQDVEATKIMGAPKQEVISKEPEPEVIEVEPVKKKGNIGIIVLLVILVVIAFALWMIPMGKSDKSNYGDSTKDTTLPYYDENATDESALEPYDTPIVTDNSAEVVTSTDANAAAPADASSETAATTNDASAAAQDAKAAAITPSPAAAAPKTASTTQKNVTSTSKANTSPNQTRNGTSKKVAVTQPSEELPTASQPSERNAMRNQSKSESQYEGPPSGDMPSRGEKQAEKPMIINIE